MTEIPLISIITVNLNNLEGLIKTMKSVFEQTWQEFEYIVIDGGSTDGSKEYIENNSEKIDYRISENDSGIYNAMNKGIKVAKGEYLLFLNSGDHFYKSNILNCVKNYLKEYSIIYFDMEIKELNKTYIKQFPAHLSFSYFTKDTLPHQGSFINKNLFDEVGFYDEAMEISSDWKFFIDAICKYNYSYLKVDQVLCSHYLNGISAKPENRNIILEERNNHLKGSYGLFMEDLKELKLLKSSVSNLKRSLKMRILMKLGIFKNFTSNPK